MFSNSIVLCTCSRRSKCTLLGRAPRSTGRDFDRSFVRSGTRGERNPLYINMAAEKSRFCFYSVPLARIYRGAQPTGKTLPVRQGARSLRDIDVVNINIKAVAPEKQFKFDACVASIYNIERIMNRQERKHTHVDRR